MTKDYPGEQWKTVKFDLDFTTNFRLEVSNFGRLRTFNKISDGNIIKGSMINGYPIVRLKFYRPREQQMVARFNYLQQQVALLAKKFTSQKQTGESESSINDTILLLDLSKKRLSKKFKDDVKERTINYHSLIHRLVAIYFLNSPAPDETIVAHLDHNKMNNRAYNLQWMTAAQNYEHQKSSPLVIKEKNDRRYGRKGNSKAAKLTVTKVMLLKKLINEGKPMKQLVKQFKVTDTQIIRIRRGENWADIEAAK